MTDNALSKHTEFQFMKPLTKEVWDPLGSSIEHKMILLIYVKCDDYVTSPKICITHLQHS